MSDVLTEEGFAKCTAFRVRAMGQRLREMCKDEARLVVFEEEVKEMINAEDAARQTRKMAKLVREASFKGPAACVEDITYMPRRKLRRDSFARLAECSWVNNDKVLVEISITGFAKSLVAPAHGNTAFRTLLPMCYVRPEDLCADVNRTRFSKGDIYF